MVSVNGAVVLGFDAILGGLVDFMRANAGSLTPESGFCRFVYDAAEEECPLTEDDRQISEDAVRQGQAPILAAAGYVLSRTSVPDSVSSAYAAGLQRLSLKDAFALDHQTFAFRPVELLGIALGAATCKNLADEARTWLENVLAKRRAASDGDYWSRSLNRIAASRLGLSWPTPALPAFQEAQVEELALRRWLVDASQRFGWLSDDRSELRTVDAMLLNRTINEGPPIRDTARAAVVHHAVRRAVCDHIQSQIAREWQIDNHSRDALELLRHLCRRFAVLAKTFAKRQRGRLPLDITDEYDVQDVLHAVLKLHFDDVRPEEWTPSYAGNSSRMDFLLKRERIVVEAKMTRKGLDQKEVANQLIQDKERYRTHPDCRALVCLVYDPGGLCHNPAALESDLSEQNASELAVSVIVSPRGL
jgi:hypothetical protein